MCLRVQSGKSCWHQHESDDDVSGYKAALDCRGQQHVGCRSLYRMSKRQTSQSEQPCRVVLRGETLFLLQHMKTLAQLIRAPHR